MNLKYLGASFLCGGAWGLIALLIGVGSLPRGPLLVGVLASPLIGVAMGILSFPAYSFPFGVRLIVPPVLLYASAFLFAAVMSLRETPEGTPRDFLIAVLVGTTMLLYILLPFAYFTHFGLGMLLKPRAKPD